VIGHLTETGRIVIRHRGAVEADIPLAPLESEAPLYRRPDAETPQQPRSTPPPSPTSRHRAALLTLVASPDLCSRRWIWDQYDSMVGGQTARRPGAADAAVVRIEDHSRALAPDHRRDAALLPGRPRDRRRPGRGRGWRNITAVGARPLAITDNMNFGNPERPEIMGQFAACIRGMAAACRALDFPVVSGNVSLYNETRGPDGAPAPSSPPPPSAASACWRTCAGGRASPSPRPSTSCWSAKPAAGSASPCGCASRRPRGRAPRPPWTSPPSAATATFVRAQILARPSSPATTCPTAACWSPWPRWRCPPAPASPSSRPRGISEHAFWFGEDQARYVLAVPDAPPLLEAARAAGVPAARLGRSGGGGLGSGRRPVHIGQSLRDAHEATLAGPDGGGVTRMAMQPAEIEALIKAALPDAQVTIEDLAGDGDHYAASVVSETFRGKSRVQQHQIVYAALQGRMGGELHALALQTSAPS
jgi:phosphoribosylformylglycinamidine synthase